MQYAGAEEQENHHYRVFAKRRRAPQKIGKGSQQGPGIETDPPHYLQLPKRSEPQGFIRHHANSSAVAPPRAKQSTDQSLQFTACLCRTEDPAAKRVQQALPYFRGGHAFRLTAAPGSLASRQRFRQRQGGNAYWGR